MNAIRRFLAVLAVVAAAAAPAWAQAQTRNEAQAQTAEIDATVTDAQNRPVADAVVVATPVNEALPEIARQARDVIDQVDKEFTPKVLAVVVGTAVRFPNHDNVRHQVYSFSAAKSFVLPLYSGVPAAPVVFDKPGVIVMGCDIHDWMVGYVYVSESPYFEKTGANGRAIIANLPPRAYTVRVWHPQLDATEESTRQTVQAIGNKRVDVAWRLALRPEVTVRRAPGGESRSRY